MANIFPSYTALLEGTQDMMRVLEPEYSNIARAGDLGGALLSGLLYTLATDVLAPAENFADRNITTSFELLGITRRNATFATVELVFRLGAAQGSPSVVPAGSIFGTAAGVRFSLNSSVTIPAEDLSHAVPGVATCLQSGTVGNVAANTVTSNVSNVAFVATVNNPNRTIDGEALESDVNITTRGTTEFRQHKMEVRESDFVEVSERVPGVLKAACLPITAVISGNFVYQAGAVTVLAMPNDGGLLTAPLKTAIVTALRAGLFVDVEKNNALFIDDFARTSITVGYTVKPNPGISSATCIAACNAAIRTFLDPRTWPSGRTVKMIEVGSVLEALTEVDSVDALTLNGGNAVPLNPYAVPFVPVGGLSGATS